MGFEDHEDEQENRERKKTTYVGQQVANVSVLSPLRILVVLEDA